MQWLNELPFAENRVLQIGFLAACGIAALIVLAILYRLTFAHRLRVPGGRTRQPRLGLVDAFSLDGQRQLVLVRRDNIEHLVMIGGPNDVLVKSQINRAVAPARESSQVSPLLVPAAPVRRTEAAATLAPSAALEQVAKIAAKPASPPPPPPVATAPPAPAPVGPPPAAPIVAPSIPKAPAPVQPTAPVPAQSSVAPQTSASEPARQSPAAPAAQGAEPARPAPASSPARQAEPRPAQPRAMMPPPIVPANASPNRGTPVRVTETAPTRGLVIPPASSPVTPTAPGRPEKGEPAVAGSKAELPPTTVKAEPSAASTATAGGSAGAASPQARTAPKTPVPAPASDWGQKTAEARAPGEKTVQKNEKLSPKVDDPFADLDSLEAEMARLLGREKPD